MPADLYKPINKKAKIQIEEEGLYLLKKVPKAISGYSSSACGTAVSIAMQSSTGARSERFFHRASD